MCVFVTRKLMSYPCSSRRRQGGAWWCYPTHTHRHRNKCNYTHTYTHTHARTHTHTTITLHGARATRQRRRARTSTARLRRMMNWSARCIRKRENLRARMRSRSSACLIFTLIRTELTDGSMKTFSCSLRQIVSAFSSSSLLPLRPPRIPLASRHASATPTVHAIVPARACVCAFVCARMHSPHFHFGLVVPLHLRVSVPCPMYTVRPPPHRTAPPHTPAATGNSENTSPPRA
jgi:hypothetical protein